MVGATVRGPRLGCVVIFLGEDPGEGAMLLRPLTSASHPPPDYFVDHMGDYEDVLASLETLNHSVLKAMGYTKKVSGCGWAWGSRA